MIEKIKYVAAAVFIVSGFACYFILLDPWATLLWVAGLVAAAVTLFFSEIGRRFVVFAKDSVTEVRKIVWPTRKETIQTTAIVFGFVVCMAFFLWLVDKGLEWILYDVVLGWRR